MILLGTSTEEITEIFDDKKVPKDKNRHYRNIRKYLMLEQMYDKFYTEDEINEICATKHISKEEFVREIVCYLHYEFAEIFMDELEQTGRLYVGGSTAVDEQYLEEHSEELIELSKRIALSFRKKTGYNDIDELESRALEIIVTKCGNLVNNLSRHPQILKSALFTKTVKYLKPMIKDNSNISLTLYDKDEKVKQRDIRTDQKFYEGTLSERIDTKRAGFNNAETEIMEYMVRLVEEGEANDIYEKIAEIMGIDEEEVIDIVEGIREKMIQKEIVKHRESGGYEFID